ncbi:MAG: HAD-IA family hydrolase [Actinobacteria bacterium]|nr:HAD-IA family hydrolase [Actinomycetota bacterium]
MIKCIFFDLGNTLINEEIAHKNRLKNMIKKLNEDNINITEIEFENLMIKASMNYAERLIAFSLLELGLTETQKNKYLRLVKYPKELEIIFEDVPELLKHLNSKYKIGVIANQSAGTEKRLNEYGILNYINLYISSSEVGLEKPSLEIFEMSLNKANCKAEEAVMVGDRLDYDIYPAKKIGMKTVRILQGFAKYQKPINTDYVPDYTINKIYELNNLF